ncbi:DUF4099 domain-containing protein [Mucilaginibacter sp. X5P1]|uniref:DUF4099 domain-containing protein n=1 Tax=Mucilaginibacter sp. X5P1 TaxID=2723088 RepID=UPI00160741EB|nr:DUF4099 domain-containing protein [Mucilaginibacter sp. X5P1]MBB6137655.1 hypothetical protein [Mucilaginibacter sp. X5P1]
MIQQLYEQRDLPIEDLRKIGLASGKDIHMSNDNISALLSGRRTEILKLSDLSYEGHHIAELEAKLSVKPQRNGELGLLVHPIYKQAPHLAFLSIEEAESLEKGEVPNIEKIMYDEEGIPKDVIVEFDQETKEFIVIDEARILVPDRINGEYLSLDQKERYRKGKEVEMSDGTIVQFSATEQEGIRSNKLALIASVLIDGGLSFVLYQGLNYLFGKKQHDEDADVYSKDYYTDLENLEQQERRGEPFARQPDKQYSRTYTRSGSR